MDPVAAFNGTDERGRQYRVYVLPERVYFMDAATMLRSFAGIIYIKNPVAEAHRHRRHSMFDDDPEWAGSNWFVDLYNWLSGTVDTERFRGMSWTDEVCELSRRSLDKRLEDHKYQFAAGPDDFLSGSLEAPRPSFWFSDYGSWRFTLGEEGEHVLSFASDRDLLAAASNLPGLLGERLIVNTAYNPKTRRWEAVAGQ